MENQLFDTFVYDKRKWQNAIDYDYLIAEPASLEAYENALILPLRWIPGTKAIYGNGMMEGGVCDENFNFIAGLYRSADGRDANKCCVNSYEVPVQDIVECHECVIFGGVLTDHFGHMLVDGLTRMWYIAQNPDDTTKVAFVVMPGQVFELWDMLELAGLSRDRIVVVDRPTRFDSVVVPGETSFSLGRPGFKREWRFVMEAIRKNVEPGTSKKIYLTRTGLEYSGCIGEEYFLEYYRSLGYEIVSPEKLTFREQVSLMAGAESIVAPMGTIAYHILFTKPGSELIALNRSNTVVRGVIMAAYAAQAHAVFIDIYKNILPEQQGGNCVFLLAPTRHWKHYLHSLPASEKSANLPDYDLSARMMEYLELWGNEYSTPDKFQWIRNETVPDVARRINKYLLGRSIKTNDYPEPKKIQSLRDDNASLEQWRQDVRNNAGTLEGRAMTGIPAHVQVDGDCFILSGHIEPSLVDPAELSLKLILTLDNAEGSLLETVPEQSVAPDGQSLDWRARIGASKLAELPVAAGSQIYGALDISRASYREAVPIHAVLTGASCVVSGFRKGLVCSVLSDAEALFSVHDYFEMVDVEPVCRVEELDWQDDELHMSLYLEHPLLGSALFEPSLVLAAENDEGEIAAENHDAASGISSVPSFELSMDYENIGPGARCYRASVDLLHVLDECAVESSAEDARDLRLGFFLRLRFVEEGREAFVPIGRKRSSEIVAMFKWHVVIGQGLLIPSENTNKDFGFDLMTFMGALERPASPRIEELEWDGDCLVMEGTFEHPLFSYPDFNMTLCLVSDSGRTRNLLATIANAEDAQHGEWRCRVDSSKIFEEMEPGTWQFAFAKTLRGACSIEAFGYRRPSGTKERFVNYVISNDRGYWVPRGIKGDSLGFRWQDNAEVKANTVPAITSLAWSDEGVLNMAGTAKHPFAGIDGFACRLLLEGSGETIDMGLECVDGSGKGLQWKVAFPACEVLADRKGEWLMVFETSIAGKMDRVPFGRKRPEGTFAVFRDFEAGSGITQFEDQDRTLGFRVGKKKHGAFFRRQGI